MILNLTQHPATPEQVEQGVVDLEGEYLIALKRALTFDTLPSAKEVTERAEYIAELACHNGLGCDDGDDPLATAALIGGAPYLMAPLERALWRIGVVPFYAFSQRESVEDTQPDGSVRKVAVFRHVGFVAAHH